jgi:elongation factor Ts
MRSFAEPWKFDDNQDCKRGSGFGAQIAVIGENMKIRRFAQVEREANGISLLIHHMGGKIGVLVDVETDVVNDAVKEMAKNVAMQAAALKASVYTSRN